MSEPAGTTTAPEAEDRLRRARMLNYRLVPLWFFLVTFGALVLWEFGVRGTPATVERIQGAVILALIVAFAIGAPIGIRFFNPLPPKT